MAMFKLGRSSDDDEQDENAGADERFQRRLAAVQRRAEGQPGAASKTPPPIPLGPEGPTPASAEPPAPVGGQTEPETAAPQPQADQNTAEGPREPQETAPAEPQETAPAEPPEDSGRSGLGPAPDPPGGIG